MAMIKCSECKKEMSDKALKCPNCGCPNVPKIKCPECGNSFTVKCNRNEVVKAEIVK